MTIHDSHPFAGEDDPVRRFRGRLGGTVTLWTAGPPEDRAGLTVTSLMVANGETPRVLALLDPDADLVDALRSTGRSVVQVLSWADRGLAEMFAGTAPAPGGLFRQAAFEDTAYGPRLASATTWAGLELEDEREVGWSVLVTCRLVEAVAGEDVDPLGHRRGRWLRLAPGTGPGPRPGPAQEKETR
ncbi:flavin reductase family protein [Nocardioides marmotae]|uniref:Flavin reductase n=1 Tax=Nocardioides marmotae TaxID=2663857 RepID=A0A6I3JBN0_9ACTN|nr:flavin reductase family protein [Nocardioides marmotae]MCR6031922.1 flavin reductase [Gordonia jinghuaiqii]MBC9732137.1 flavin reductase [Nocardioides marmotae]MTB83258.1 flavin reductase [Nocardioides marmotae]MTB95562.1 flavin reductase [Nocardioides marmotae]QKE00984.1 flavin reductase [Nocardioides marmotae]